MYSCCTPMLLAYFYYLTLSLKALIAFGVRSVLVSLWIICHVLHRGQSDLILSGPMCHVLCRGCGSKFGRWPVGQSFFPSGSHTSLGLYWWNWTRDSLWSRPRQLGSIFPLLRKNEWSRTPLDSKSPDPWKGLWRYMPCPNYASRLGMPPLPIL